MALEYYQQLGYVEINKFLRESSNISQTISENPNDETVRQILEIDSRMTNTGEFNNVLLYRGFSGGFIPMAIEFSSGVIVNKAYSSSSTTLDTAKKFVSDDGCCVIVFKLPNNIKYHKFVIDYEQEVLIERDTQFVIDLKSSKHPIYYATLSKWYPPSQNIIESEMKHLITSLRDVLTQRCNKIGEANFKQERMQKYIDEGEPEDEAEELADIDVLEYC